MNAITGIRMKNPAHPGGFVKSEIVEALELSVTDAAKVLGVTRPALSALLNERTALSPEMALRIEPGKSRLRVLSASLATPAPRSRKLLEMST